MDLHWTIPRSAPATTKTLKMHVLLIVHSMLLAACNSTIKFLLHHHLQTRIRILSMSTIIEVRKKFIRIISVTLNGCRQHKQHKTWKLTTRTKQSDETRKIEELSQQEQEEWQIPQYCIIEIGNWRKHFQLLSLPGKECLQYYYT